MIGSFSEIQISWALYSLPGGPLLEAHFVLSAMGESTEP